MAQAKTINEILKELSKNYTSVLSQAVQQAANTACDDIYKFSMSVLDQYYANYEPSRYNRSDSLWRATVPILEIANKGDTIMATVGIRYDASLLDAYVAGGNLYDGSAKYGKADGQWVIENYLLGIHPATNGSSNPDTVIYTPWQDARSPHEYLSRYLKLYTHKFHNNIDNYVISHIAKQL